jgi:metal transporter CNNM
VSETILMRLLKQDVIFHIKMKDKERFKSDPASVIYQQGKPVDYFVLILEGRVEVTVGRENLVFESGPFTYFGSQALHQNIGIGEFVNAVDVGFFTLTTIPFSAGFSGGATRRDL